MINNTPELFPLTVDIYQENAVIHVFKRIEPDIYTELEKALRDILLVTSFFYKKNSQDNFVIPESPDKKFVQEEYGCKFLVNLSEYLDTGLFLDHRETRKWVASQSENKVILNTFAYTGSFSVYAAKAGAKKTCSVDISRVYCAWIRENLALNQLALDKNWIYKMDTLEFFQYAKKKNLIFDIIIIDPPTFSSNKGKTFSVQKDHPELITNAMEVLAQSGFILFSTNYKQFRFKRDKLPPGITTQKLNTIPPDFAGTQPHICFVIRKPQNSGQ